MKVAFLNCLKAFYRHNQAWPDLVVVFRDGVSDTQLKVVQDHEVPQFLSCFKEMNNGGPVPKFAYVVVQKRINTRLYNIPRPGEYDNPAPGTVVDYHITRRTWYDFFLVSQRVTQGTVTPVHFVVICDNANIPPDVLQKLSYKLTHMYFNWTGTVRVPAPCQVSLSLYVLSLSPKCPCECKHFIIAVCPQIGGHGWPTFEGKPGWPGGEAVLSIRSLSYLM